MLNQLPVFATARLIITGASRGQALAYARNQGLLPGEWYYIPGTGAARVYVFDEEASAAARAVRPLLPSESLDEHREQVIEALRERGVVAAWIFGSVGRGVDTGRDDVELVVDFTEPPQGLALAGRMVAIETVVYGLTGFLCDAIDARSPEAERLAPTAERVELFDDRA